MPGHDGVPVAAGARGGARGCIQRSNISMMRMRPPQQGQGGRQSMGSGASPGFAVGGVGSAMTPRRMRRARLCARRSVESDLAARDVQAFSQVPGERRADGVRRNLAFGPRLRRHVALTGICRPALWPPRVRRQSLCPFSTPRRIHADSDRPQRYRNSPRSLKHARLNKPMTRSSPCEGGPESIGAIWRDIDRMMTALTAASARRLNIASSVCCNAKLIETVQHSVMTH